MIYFGHLLGNFKSRFAFELFTCNRPNKRSNKRIRSLERTSLIFRKTSVKSSECVDLFFCHSTRRQSILSTVQPLNSEPATATAFECFSIFWSPSPTSLTIHTETVNLFKYSATKKMKSIFLYLLKNTQPNPALTLNLIKNSKSFEWALLACEIQWSHYTFATVYMYKPFYKLWARAGICLFWIWLTFCVVSLLCILQIYDVFWPVYTIFSVFQIPQLQTFCTF